MSDVERLLTEAGEQWRAEQPPAPEPDLARLTRHRWRRTMPVIASAAAVLVVVAGVLVVRAVADHKDNPPAAGLAKLILRDGDTAEATGNVVAESGRPVRFCPFLPQASLDAAAPSGSAPQGPQPCASFGVTVTGVDLGKLSNRRNSGGVISGDAKLRGVYRDRNLRVTAQSGVPRGTAPTEPDLPGFVTKTPCAAPPGGWTGAPNNEAIARYLSQHTDRFNGLGVNYPIPKVFRIWVAVVGVSTGDLAEAQAELQARFGPNVCTVRVPYTVAEQKKAWKQLETLMKDPANGIYEATGLGNFRPLTATLAILTQRLYDKLSAIGLHELSITVWLKPVR